MRLTAKPLALIILVVIFGGVLLTGAFDWWTTETTRIPATFSEGEAAGQYDPADIRGSYTFGDVESSFAVPAAELAAAFALPPDVDAAAFEVKDLESLYADLEVEIGTASVRLFTAFYTGLPYDLSAEESYLPRQAVELLIARGNLSADRLAYLDGHTLDLATQPEAEGATPSAPQIEATPTVAHTPEAEDGTIRGKTTFQELLDWGVPPERIETVLGGAMPASGTLIKDYATAQGLEFATLRDALQLEVDAVLTR
ncbi:hypothetical protein FDZ74_10045 [bacterium]|nr:MAG: hypothetical protein FDZ74_10045 [bacterium]